MLQKWTNQTWRKLSYFTIHFNTITVKEDKFEFKLYLNLMIVFTLLYCLS